jgi:hypothetical protein
MLEVMNYLRANGFRTTPTLYDEAKSKGWNVISMKNDWRRIFTFDK